MGFTTDSAMVRVDFFKAGGKWYTTEAVKFEGYNDPDIRAAFAASLRKHLGTRLSEMDAVCLEPYHKNEYPVMLKGGEWINYK